MCQSSLQLQQNTRARTELILGREMNIDRSKYGVLSQSQIKDKVVRNESTMLKYVLFIYLNEGKTHKNN